MFVPPIDFQIFCKIIWFTIFAQLFCDDWLKQQMLIAL